jgi:pimeloyl-ACP methyl ester carboxylesterase
MPQKCVVSIGKEKLIGIFEKGNNSPDACVITCHGLLASKDGPKYILLATELQKIGISSFRFDFRGCGESEGRLSNSNITNRKRDLEAVIAYVTRKLGYKKIGLFGSSMGGFISFLLAASEPRVKALVSLATPFSMTELFEVRERNGGFYEIDGILFNNEFISDVRAHGTLPKDLLSQILCPTLLFHGTFDLLVPLSHAHKLFENLTSKKELQVIDGGDHIFSYPMHLGQIIQSSTEWFGRYLI